MSGRAKGTAPIEPQHQELQEASPTVLVLEALGYRTSRVSRLRVLADGRHVRRICFTKQTDGARLVVRFALTLRPTAAK